MGNLLDKMKQKTKLLGDWKESVLENNEYFEILPSGINEFQGEKDGFFRIIQLDNGETVEVLKNIFAEFIKDIELFLIKAIGERAEYLDKFKKDSAAVSGFLARRRK